MRLRTIITSAALSPTGPFRHACDFLIVSTEESGSALPCFASAPSPASTSFIVNFVEDLSLMVSRIFFAAAVCSGPIPSPLIREMLYLANHISLAFRVESLSKQHFIYCIHHCLNRRDDNVFARFFRRHDVAILVFDLDGDYCQRVRAACY